LADGQYRHTVRHVHRSHMMTWNQPAGPHNTRNVKNRTFDWQNTSLYFRDCPQESVFNMNKWLKMRFQRFVVRPCWTDQFPPWWVFSYQRPELSFPKANVIFLLTCSSPTTQTNLSYKTFKTWTQMISVSYSADVTPTMLNNWGFLLFFYLFSSIKVNINIIMYFRANHWMKLKTVKCTFCFQLV